MREQSAGAVSRGRAGGEGIVRMRAIDFTTGTKRSVGSPTVREGNRPLLTLGLLTLLRVSVVNVLILMTSALLTLAQNPTPSTDTLKKANTRPADPKSVQTDPFDGAAVEKMTGQCVTLDTESGLIVIEMLPKAAPENARSFLNLAASGALDTTTFSRVV